jgi:hypothetical protein
LNITILSAPAKSNPTLMRISDELLSVTHKISDPSPSSYEQQWLPIMTSHWLHQWTGADKHIIICTKFQANNNAEIYFLNSCHIPKARKCSLTNSRDLCAAVQKPLRTRAAATTKTLLKTALCMQAGLVARLRWQGLRGALNRNVEHVTSNIVPLESPDSLQTQKEEDTALIANNLPIFHICRIQHS